MQNIKGLGTYRTIRIIYQSFGIIEKKNLKAYLKREWLIFSQRTQRSKLNTHSQWMANRTYPCISRQRTSQSDLSDQRQNNYHKSSNRKKIVSIRRKIHDNSCHQKLKARHKWQLSRADNSKAIWCENVP